jgi:hypothetical protein
MARRLVSVVGLVAACCLSSVALASAAGWHYTFRDFFGTAGNSYTAGTAKATKCAGRKIGTYAFRDSVRWDTDAGPILIDVTSKMSARADWARMSHVAVSADRTPNISPESAQALEGWYSHFFSTVSTRYDRKHDELDVRHGSLLFRMQVLGPGRSTTEFKPRPGC